MKLFASVAVAMLLVTNVSALDFPLYWPPGFQYQPIAEPEIAGNGGRVLWVAGRPGEPPVYAGTDFIVTRDGKISALYLFFDKLPTPAP